MATHGGVIKWCLQVQHRVHHSSAETDQELFEQLAGYLEHQDSDWYREWPPYELLASLVPAYSRTVRAIYDRKHPYEVPIPATQPKPEPPVTRPEPIDGLVGLRFTAPANDRHIPYDCTTQGWILAREGTRNYLVQFDGRYRDVTQVVPLGSMRQWQFRYPSDAMQREIGACVEVPEDEDTQREWLPDPRSFKAVLEGLLAANVLMGVRLTGAGGVERIARLTTVNRVVDYLRDPQGFAAAYFGFQDVEGYREWFDTGGLPLCGATTRMGRLCGNWIKPHRLPADQWRALHRNRLCHVHPDIMQQRQVRVRLEDDDTPTTIVQFPRRAGK